MPEELMLRIVYGLAGLGLAIFGAWAMLAVDRTKYKLPPAAAILMSALILLVFTMILWVALGLPGAKTN